MDRSLSLPTVILVLLDSDVLVAKVIAIKFCLVPPVKSRTPLCGDTFKKGTQTASSHFLASRIFFSVTQYVTLRAATVLAILHF